MIHCLGRDSWLMNQMSLSTFLVSHGAILQRRKAPGAYVRQVACAILGRISKITCAQGRAHARSDLGGICFREKTPRDFAEGRRPQLSGRVQANRRVLFSMPPRRWCHLFVLSCSPCLHGAGFLWYASPCKSNVYFACFRESRNIKGSWRSKGGHSTSLILKVNEVSGCSEPTKRGIHAGPAKRALRLFGLPRGGCRHQQADGDDRYGALSCSCSGSCQGLGWL